MNDEPRTTPNLNPFWAFSLSLYGREEAATACLDLQDRLGLDVNLVLFCCWAGSRGRALSESEIQTQITATRAWRDEVVQPLRGARRWLKSQTLGPAPQALREVIKASELSAEAIQQSLMHEALPVGDGAASASAVAGNLCAYLNAEGAAVQDADREALAKLMCATVPGLSKTEAEQALRG